MKRVSNVLSLALIITASALSACSKDSSSPAAPAPAPAAPNAPTPIAAASFTGLQHRPAECPRQVVGTWDGYQTRADGSRFNDTENRVRPRSYRFEGAGIIESNPATATNFIYDGQVRELTAGVPGERRFYSGYCEGGTLHIRSVTTYPNQPTSQVFDSLIYVEYGNMTIRNLLNGQRDSRAELTRTDSNGYVADYDDDYIRDDYRRRPRRRYRHY